MEKGKKNSVMIKYTLRHQSPLIHFQSDEKRAVLKASEVKPKLDAFLIRYFTKNGIDYSHWVKPAQEGGKNPALDYKLSFASIGEVEKVQIGYKTDYDIYYGNMGDGKKVSAVKADVEMTIVCFIPELREQLTRERLSAFFVTQNFGRMQDKGFGSYIIDIQMKPEEICEILKKEYSARACYWFKATNRPFKQIKTIYAIMKSGINLKKRISEEKKKSITSIRCFLTI